MISSGDQKDIQNRKSVRDDYLITIATFHDGTFNLDQNFVFTLTNSWRMDIIDAIHYFPLICFGVDMIFNKLRYPFRHLAILLLTVLYT